MFHAFRDWLWPAEIFKDANRGSWLERAAAYRYNRAQRGCLVVYLVRWGTLFVLLLGMVFVFTPIWGVLAAGAGVLVAVAAAAIMVLAVTYTFLTYWDT